MKKVNHILQNPQYCKMIEQINTLEADRPYCRHGLPHLLDVARIAYIISLENQYDIAKEVIYGTALLHDLGKSAQYLNGTPHELESAKAAPDVLKEAGYSDEEIKMITEAILAHRKPESGKAKNLKGILYQADKRSRACFNCMIENRCNWSEDKKNKYLEY